MKVTIANEHGVLGELVILFHKTPLGERRRKNKKELIDTTCEIFCKEKLVAQATALQNPLDSYNKVIGKKVALAKALKRIDWLYAHPNYFQKEMRAAIWQVFYRVFGRWN